MDTELSTLHINGKPFFRSKGEYKSIINHSKHSFEDGIELMLSDEEYRIFRSLTRILPRPIHLSFNKKYEGIPQVAVAAKIIQLVKRSDDWLLRFELRR